MDKKVFITGISGVLGSSIAELSLKKGFEVIGNDITRIEESWRLGEIRDRICYLWKSSTDLEPTDLEGVDVVLDCGIGFADRPFGISSPWMTALGNLFPPFGLLEAIKKLGKRPVVLYASSFNVFYGSSKVKIAESTPPQPSSIYGWTKAASELLYRAYHKAYNIPTVIARVGSAFGSRMRSDELSARLIIYSLQGRDFKLRSPKARRLWTYSKDIMDFYDKLLDRIEEFNGAILHCAGNRGDEIITNLELAHRIKAIMGSDMKVEEVGYESGEMLGNTPVSFEIDATKSRKALDWEPRYSLDEGLRETISWFWDNLWRYT